MSEWKTYKLGELGVLARGKSKHRPRDAAFLYGGKYPFIQTGDIKAANHRISKHTQTYSEEGLKQSKLWDKGTICITIAANIADTAILEYPACFPDSVIGFIPNKEVCNVDFMEYQLQFAKRNLQSHSIGSVQDNINLGTFQNFTVDIPDLPTQTQIAQILTSLDDKIELNLQMNQTLEAMAQALFKEWFVDFNFPKSSESGFTELKNEQNNQINTKFCKSLNSENSDSDKLPKGWKMGKVGEILQPKRGRNITKAEAIEGIFPVVAGGLEPSCYHNESNTKEPVITISSSGANAGFVRLYQMPVWSADSCFIDSSIFPFVHYCYVFLKSNQKNIYDSQEGSAQPHIYPRHIMDLNICIGNEDIVQQFEEIVTPLFEKIKYNSLQIQTLTQTRDTLLPKLMSGKISLNQDFQD